MIKTEDMDGWKYFFNKNEWFMVRPSGTEPVLRLYAEAETREKAIDLLKTCYTGLLAAVSDWFSKFKISASEQYSNNSDFPFQIYTKTI